jgi:hypothetical protein
MEPTPSFVIAKNNPDNRLALLLEVEEDTPPGQSYPVAFVSLMNQSDEPYVISHNGDPFQYLDIIIVDEKNQQLSAWTVYGSMLLRGPLQAEETTLPPKSSLRRVVALLGHIDYSVRCRGVYTAQAQYSYRDTTLLSGSCTFNYTPSSLEDRLAEQE